MMKAIRLFIPLVLFAFLFNACSIQQRHYMPGYHVQWNQSVAVKPKGQIKEKTLTEIASKKSDSLSTEEYLPLMTSAATKGYALKRVTSKTSKHFKDVQLMADTSKANKSEQQDDYRQPKNSSSNAKGGEGKSQLVALLLCIFVGAFGIHRFYLGYIGIGIVQVLTLGCCGIWSLIDLILIITGDLKPKDGSYSKTLDDI